MSTTMKRNLILAGIISASCVAFPSASHALFFSLTPSDFSVTAGAGSNNADPLQLLNTTTGPAVGTLVNSGLQANTGGFNGFFNSTYLSIGATSNQTIGSSLRQVNSTATSTAFALDAAALANGLTIQFNYTFAGYVGTQTPTFDVSLVNTGLFLFQAFPGANGVTLSDTGTASAGKFNRDPNSGLVTTTIDAATLASLGATATGGYDITISLTEPAGSASTDAAAGFNAIRVADAASIPFDFDPSAGVLLLGAGFGLNKLRKNLQAKKSEPKV